MGFCLQSERYKEIAVKVFLNDMDRLNVERKKTEELLEISRKPKNLVHAYKEIRQEVSFLSTLENPFLVEVFGVRTYPYMCFLLELAPMGSLFTILKEYKTPLEALTLKNTARQVNVLCLMYLVALYLSHSHVRKKMSVNQVWNECNSYYCIAFFVCLFWFFLLCLCMSLFLSRLLKVSTTSTNIRLSIWT